MAFERLTFSVIPVYENQIKISVPSKCALSKNDLMKKNRSAESCCIYGILGQIPNDWKVIAKASQIKPSYL